MKILYKTMGLGLLSACLCLLCAAPASAKVCFVGDENCGAGGSFEPAEELPNEDLCRQEGYTSLASTCLNPGGTCPYDARYVKCCPSEYAYQACVFPLETVKIQNSEGKTVADKCGSLFKCKCNSEYKTPADWSSQASSACQPGGGVCIMSTTDTVYYNKCVCDVNYFPYEGSCPDNMTQIESCRDSDGKTRVSCQCPSNYRTCTYGGAPGAKSCKQGGLTLYSSCKSAEDECENAGYFKDCYTQTCYYDTNSTIYDKGRYPTSCEDSYEACPYAYGFYKCRWSAESYCAKWDMTEYSKQLPSTCTKDGVQGTVIPCNLGGSYNGGGSTSNYLGYYRCKLTCEQQARGAISQGYLTVNNNIVDSKGNYGFVRTDSKGKHLYLIGDIEIPKVRVDSGGFGWGHAQVANEGYVSVNGINALYDIDSKRYSSCSENRTSSHRPTVSLNNNRIHSSNTLLDVNLSDVNIAFKFSNGDSDTSEYYELKNSHTWKNVKLSETGSMPESGYAARYQGQVYIGDKDHGGSRYRNKIHLNDKVTLIFTGYVDFYASYWCFENSHDSYNNSHGGCTSWTQFHTGNKAMIRFQNADIYTSYYWDWDGASNSTMLFENSNGSMGKVWSHWNLGFSNSNITFKLLRTYGWFPEGAKSSFGGTYSASGVKETAGIYLTNNSTVKVTGYWTYLTGQRAKVYIAPGSTFQTMWPFYNDGDDEVICIPNKDTSKFIACNGSSSSCYTNGANAPLYSDSGYQRYFLYRGNNGGNTCFPAYGEGQNYCGWNTVRNNRLKGGSASSGNWTNIGSQNGWLMSGCGYPEKHGLGYNF